MAHYERKIAEKEIFRGKIIGVRVDTVELENGRIASREVVTHPGGACIAPLDKDGCLYMVKQFRYAIGKELLELPAGKLEPGEDPFPAAVRELAEECGLTAKTFTNLGLFYPTVGYCSEIIYTWLATDLSPVPPHPDDDEFLTPIRVPVQEAIDKIMDGEICDGKTIAAVMKIRQMGLA